MEAEKLRAVKRYMEKKGCKFRKGTWRLFAKTL